MKKLSPPPMLKKDHEHICRMLMDYDSLSLQSRKESVEFALSFVAHGSQTGGEYGEIRKVLENKKHGFHCVIELIRNAKKVIGTSEQWVLKLPSSTGMCNIGA